jgi:two-component system, NtrC family, sensor kinase
VSQASILIIQGVDQGVRFELDQAEVGLGRGVQSTIRIHDSEVSRSHARITRTDGKYRIIDLNSSNGTYVNGVAVHERELAHGDELQLGRTVLVFSQAGSPNESQLVADRVELAAGPDSDARSNIVQQAGPQDASALGRMATEAPPGAPLSNLQVLYRITEEVVRPSNTIEQLFSRILELSIDVTGADRGCLLLRDVATGQLVPQVFRHRRGYKQTDRMVVSRTIVDYVIRDRQGVRTSDAPSDARFAPGQSILQAGIREAICVPMQGRYDLQGALYIDITTPPERAILEERPGSRFNEELLRLMVAIGRQAAIAVEDYRYRQALIKSERLAAVGQTIAILSHHIKNILQGVRGGSYLIDMGLKDQNQDLVRKGWTIVEKNQNKILHLVMDMLTFSKDRQPKMTRADLNETVRDVYELMQARAEELHARFEYQPSPGPLMLTFDPEGIHRAVLNIVSNALDAIDGREDPVVTVSIRHDPAAGTVSVEVADNGPGIARELLANLFNIFESTKGARGTGIGLAVSQKIIREHGGDVFVDSSPGQGARFTLEWPASEEEPAASQRKTTTD